MPAHRNRFLISALSLFAVYAVAYGGIATNDARFLTHPPQITWDVPDWVGIAPNSAMYFPEAAPDRPYMSGKQLNLSWAECNPSEGVYDFTAIENELASGMKIVVRMKCSVISRESKWPFLDTAKVPAWVTEKYSLTNSKIAVTGASASTNEGSAMAAIDGSTAPGWRHDVRGAHITFTLQTNTSIDEIQIAAYNSSHSRGYIYDVYTSQDGSAFYSLTSITSIDAPGMHSYAIPATNVRYIRLVSQGHTLGGDWSYVDEFAIPASASKSFYTRKNTNEHILVAAPWHEGVQHELSNFIAEFGTRAFFEHEDFIGLYIHGISTSYGEEMWLDGDYVAGAEAAGMSPQALYDAFAARFDWWADAAGTNTHKLGWMMVGGIPGYQNTAYENLDAYAFSLGIGHAADGYDLVYNKWSPYAAPSDMGQVYDEATKRVTIDWDWAPRADRRFWASEQEETLSEDSEALVGYSVQSGLFRSVLMGSTALWIGNMPRQYDESMFRWAAYQIGKSPSNAPEAAVWLREEYGRDGRADVDSYTIANFSHLLQQYDHPGYETKNALFIERNYVWTDPRLPNGDKPEKTIVASARRTDTGGGQNGVLFYINDEFEAALSNAFELRVDFFDAAANEWSLRIHTNGIPCVCCRTNNGAMEWKSASFMFDGTFTPAQGPYASDFALAVDGGGDLIVRFVRVIRLSNTLATNTNTSTNTNTNSQPQTNVSTNTISPDTAIAPFHPVIRARTKILRREIGEEAAFTITGLTGDYTLTFSVINAAGKMVVNRTAEMHAPGNYLWRPFETEGEGISFGTYIVRILVEQNGLRSEYTTLIAIIP